LKKTTANSAIDAMGEADSQLLNALVSGVVIQVK